MSSTDSNAQPGYNNWASRRADSAHSRPNDHRTPYQRDRARILHSAAFRRLQAKTQIIGVGQNDFYRTRLTHSLEVAQIGTGLTSQLRMNQPELQHYLPDDALIESLCLAHDIGHPPFGHGGETALNHLMQAYGGFEGNGQTFRIVAVTEPYTPGFGMDVARRTLLGLLKYPATLDNLVRDIAVNTGCYVKAAKGIYACDQTILDWTLEPLSSSDKNLFQSFQETEQHAKTRFKSLDASIMELADDIAYGVHDLEDAIATNFISRDQWESWVLEKLATAQPDMHALCQDLTPDLFNAEHYKRKQAIGTIVNTLITSVELFEQDDDFHEPLIRLNARLNKPQETLLDILKQFVYRYVVRNPDIQRIEFKGQYMVERLFKAFSQQPDRLLPENTRNRWEKAVNLSGDQGGMRVICDYISGMTDEYATKMYKTMFTV